jgi:hypothetical protein
MFLFNVLLIVSTSERESIFAALYSDINSLKSGLFHKNGQPNSQKGRAKVSDGIILVTTFLETLSVDQ